MLLFNSHDLIYIHYANHSLLPFLILRRMSKKSIVNFHGSDLFPDNLFKKFLKKITKGLIKDFKGVVVPSEYFKEEVVKQFGISEKKIFVSPSGGIDLSLFSSTKNKRSNENEIIFGYVGRLDKGKGFELLIPLALKLKTQGFKFKFHVIGGGSLLELYKEQVKQQDLSLCFNFFGMQPQNKLPNFLRSMDVFIFPSYRKGESLGLVGVEAMACGVPVIGSNIGGIATYVKENYNGFLFEVGDVNSLIMKVLQFISLDDEERKYLSENAIFTAKEYDSQHVNENMIKYIKEINEIR